MHHDLASRALLPALITAAMSLAAPLTAATTKPADYAAFAKANDAAMGKMMAEMEVRPTGDVDADFVAMMIPHHQGAVDMAKAVLRYGKNPKLRALARGIVEQQTKEIAIMRATVGARVATPAPDGMHRHMQH